MGILGLEIFTSSPVAYITADFKKVLSNLFHTGSILIERECIKSTEEQGYWNVIQKHITMHQSDFTCKYSVKSLTNQCKLVSEEVKKTPESTKQ